MELPVLFLPANQNKLQRVGYIAALGGAILVVFLHNPLDGYTTERLVTTSAVVPKECSAEKMAEYRRLGEVPENLQTREGVDRLHRRNELSHECFELAHDSNNETLTFSEWSSKAPIVAWLGSVIHVLAALVAVFAVGVLWLIVFKDEPPRVQGPES